jgi:MFS transporter, MHS family, proline/betaine transporter
MSVKYKIFRLLKISLGNVIEWYDFCLYGYFADIIAKEFFPDASHFVALLATFAAFGVGFLARPLGGIIFGYIGDRTGRFYAMNLAIICMGIPTILMACLPTYNAIGIAAPVLLVIIRIMQGLSAGGQYSNLLTITTEDKMYRYKGFNNGIAYSVTIVGFVFAAVVSYICITFLPQSWQGFAWRIPFAFSVILLITQFALREKDHKHGIDPDENLAETEKKDISEKVPLIVLLKWHKKALISIILLGTVTSTLYYLIITYLVTFTVDIEKLSMAEALQINAFALVLLSLSVPFFGFLSDIMGRKKCLVLAFVIFVFTCYPILSLLDHHSYTYVLLATLGLTFCTAWVQGASTPFYTEIFPTAVRSSGCSVSYGIGVAIAGFAPMAATIFDDLSFHGLNYYFYFIIAMGFITVIFIPAKKIEFIRLKNLKANSQ